MKSAVHGGDPHAIARLYGVNERALLDFSANIDPSGPPGGVAHVLSRAAAHPTRLAPYPERSYAHIRKAIAIAENLDPDSIVIGNGSSSLIDAAIRISGAARCIAPTPAFSEYERAAAAAGISFIGVPLGPDFSLEVRAFREILSMPSTCAIVNTPHNPSGTLLDREVVLALAACAQQNGSSLLVDEAFIDYVPDHSIALHAATLTNIVVLRSLTKFYSLAGVRIGYAVTHPSRAKELQELLPSWPVGSLDCEIATAAVADRSYRASALKRIHRNRPRLAAALRGLGVRIVPSAANFLLLELPISSADMDEFLGTLVRDHGVVVRDCRSYDGMEERSFIRVAVRRRRENDALARAIEKALRAHRG